MWCHFLAYSLNTTPDARFVRIYFEKFPTYKYAKSNNRLFLSFSRSLLHIYCVTLNRKQFGCGAFCTFRTIWYDYLYSVLTTHVYLYLLYSEMSGENLVFKPILDNFHFQYLAVVCFLSSPFRTICNANVKRDFRFPKWYYQWHERNEWRENIYEKCKSVYLGELAVVTTGYFHSVNRKTRVYSCCGHLSIRHEDISIFDHISILFAHLLQICKSRSNEISWNKTSPNKMNIWRRENIVWGAKKVHVNRIRSLKLRLFLGRILKFIKCNIECESNEIAGNFVFQ